MFETFYKDYLNRINQKYPSTQNLLEKESLQKLISPAIVSLKEAHHHIIKKSIRDFYRISRTKEYQDSIKTSHLDILNLKTSQNSVLMAYDFHINRDEVKLIEINTNASGFLFAESLYNHKNNYIENLKTSFIEDFKDRNDIAIIDENIKEQKMYPEFLMYKDLLNSWGIKSFICEYNDSKIKEGLSIYNRYCDFYLEDENSQNLKELYMNQKINLSPHPKEYLLLADKQRLIEMSLNRESYPDIDPVLLEAFETHSMSRDDLWAVRKKYFFKPKNSFGSKSTYRGKSLARKNFDRMYDENSLAQEYFPPQEIDFNEQQWKYDLRAYAYKDDIQMMAARIYQGQLTNFKTDFGGFARVKVDSEAEWT